MSTLYCPLLDADIFTRLGPGTLFALTAGRQIEKMTGMNDESVLTLLEETAEKLSIKLGYEDLRKGVVATPGGIFVLRGEQRILIHKGLSLKEKIDVLTDILSGVDTEDIHLPPDVRKRLDRVNGGQGGLTRPA